MSINNEIKGYISKRLARFELAELKQRLFMN